MEESRNLFPAQNRRQVTCLFRIGSVSEAPGSAERLDVEKAERRQVLPYGIPRQLAILKQFRLIFTDVSRVQTIGGTAKSSSKIFHCTKVVAYGILCIITTLEFFQHHFSKMGHGNTSCDPHLHQATEQPMLRTSRAASAAGRLRPNAVIGEVPISDSPCTVTRTYQELTRSCPFARFDSEYVSRI